MIDAINRTYRRIVHAIRPAKTTNATVESGVVQTVQVQLNAYEMRELPSVQSFGFASSLPIGSDVVISNFAGDNSNGCIIASNHQGTRPLNMTQGEVRVYDQRGQYVYLKSDGTIVVQATNAATVIAPTVTIVGNLVVTGDVSDKNGAHGTLDHFRSAYDGHAHGGVATGTYTTQATNSPV